MYAVIRAGGKQHKVAPGDVLRIDKTEHEGQIEAEVLAVRGDDGGLTSPNDARVTATVLGNDRGKKVLVFHYKRKKQYKKLYGHRQPFTRIRIDSIFADGREYNSRD